MRILIAHDGSDGADQALDLVASVSWPPDSVFRIVHAIPDTREIRRRWAGLILDATVSLEDRLREEAGRVVQAAADRLAHVDRTVEQQVVVGRAPQALVEDARGSASDLVVIGSRGLGPFATTLLGSVSAEVVDAAPCPVLVSRSARLRAIVLATDGSPCASHAERFLARLPLARGVPVTVVSVGSVFHPWHVGIAPTMVSQAMDAAAAEEAHVRAVHEGYVRESAHRLREAGIDARPVLRMGDPVHEVLAAADEARADLIVLGSRGQTGLRRLVTGSVARGVLTRSHGSVMVVRRCPEDAPGGGPG